MFEVDCVIICLYIDVNDLCDTNINVINAIKLSHFEVKILCDTNVMCLSIIENILIYVNHTLNTVKKFNNLIVLL